MELNLTIKCRYGWRRIKNGGKIIVDKGPAAIQGLAAALSSMNQRLLGGKTGGDGGGKPVKSEVAPLFQNPETDEIEHYFPAFALSWTLNWGRITNGERVIEDLPIGPEFSLLPSEADGTAPFYTTPGVHGRWEQTSNSRVDGALYHAG